MSETYYEKNKEHIKKRHRKYYNENAEYRKKARQCNKNCAEKRQQTINALKINGCAICGYNGCIAALDFHHVNPKDKKYNICGNSIRKKDITEEINKCILLCNRCHKEIHYNER